MKLFHSIKAKLLIFGLCISLIPITIITTIYYFSTRSTLKRQIMQDMTAVAESRKAHVLEFLKAKKAQARYFSTDGFIRDTLKNIGETSVTALNRHLLVNKMPLDPYMTAIAVADLGGNVVACTTGDMIGTNIFGEGGFPKNRDEIYSKPYIKMLHDEPLLGTTEIDVFSPIISSPSAEPLGFIINHYNMSTLNEISDNRAGMGNTGEVVLAQKSGDDIKFLTSLRYAPDLEHVQSVPFDSRQAEPMRLALEGGNGTIIAPDYRGTDVVAAYQYIPPLNAGLVAKIDMSEAFAPIQRLGMVAMIVGLISAAVVVGMAIVIAVSASRPIGKLTDATRRFAGGDLKSRVDITRKDEIGELANGFNEMAKGLEQLTKSLEERVAQRTFEVTRKSEELEQLTKSLEEHATKLTLANVRLKELDQLKSMFIASMSHELRTPLNSIIGFTGVVLQGLAGEISEQQKDYLSRANRSSKHLLGLINDIIDISKVEAGKVEVLIAEFTLDEVVREAVESVQPQINEKGLTLFVSIPPGVRLKTDRKRLLQCILNYLSNAVKFTEAGTVSIAARETDGEVEISVSDTGIGIAREDLPKLFNAFIRLDSALRTKTLGTGLGLYLTQKLATELLGGTVAAQSQLGKGSTFTLRLPKERRRKKA